MDILDNPEASINPRVNPFNPVGVIESLNQSLFSVMKSLNSSNNDSDIPQINTPIENNQFNRSSRSPLRNQHSVF